MPNASKKRGVPEVEGHTPAAHSFPQYAAGVHPTHNHHHSLTGHASALQMLPYGHHQNAYAHVVGTHQHAMAAVQMMNIDQMAIASLSPAQQLEALVKMVLNAIVVQNDDEVIVPYGITKKNAGGKVAEPEAARYLEAFGEGGEGIDAANRYGAFDVGAGNDMMATGPVGNDEVAKVKDGPDESRDLIGILRACLKKAGEESDGSLKKHVNKILKAPPFNMSSGPIYFYTPETPRNELEHANRTPVVRGILQILSGPDTHKPIHEACHTHVRKMDNRTHVYHMLLIYNSSSACPYREIVVDMMQI